MLGKLLATTNVSLSTTAAAVTAPTDLTFKASTVVLSAESGGDLVVWERQVASDSAVSKFCSASESSLEMSVNPGQTIFYAKLTASTATLDVEWWG